MYLLKVVTENHMNRNLSFYINWLRRTEHPSQKNVTAWTIFLYCTFTFLSFLCAHNCNYLLWNKCAVFQKCLMGVMAWFGSSFFMVLDWMEPSWIGWNHRWGWDGTICGLWIGFQAILAFCSELATAGILKEKVQ